MSSWDDVGKTWCVALWAPGTNGWVYGPRAVPYSRRSGTGAHYDYELSSAASGLTHYSQMAISCKALVGQEKHEFYGLKYNSSD